MNPQLVLHICCAPDEAWVVHTLQNSYRLHCFFCNPNIDTPEEFDKRCDEARQVAATFGVGFDHDPYDPSAWEEAAGPFLDTPEGGGRCQACFLVRLKRTAEFCREHRLERFTSVMSVSPHKNIRMLATAGLEAAQHAGVEWVPFDFKKKDGFLQSIRLSRQMGLYRQDYCGCRLSREERGRRYLRSEAVTR